MKNPKILIIGAGAAGISTANRLIEYGLNNISIFEAENRIGGRIHSIKLDNTFIDLGAQWCHGENDNIVYTLAKDFNVLGSSFCKYKNLNYYDSSGKMIDSELSKKFENILWEIQESYEMSNETEDSFGDYFKKK